MLPICKHKDEILEAVRNHKFTIVSAETGSGKSTQIVQFLADEYQQIIVTEPRVMAAKTLARRVAYEMGATLGKEVGYKTAFDKCFSSDSKILYCTDGLQVVRTIFNENKTQENVLIIDEVHEWNRNIETLIAWSKYMKDTWNTKVVIMSATLDTTTLADFFEGDVAEVNVPGTLYEVEVEERDFFIFDSFIGTIEECIAKKQNVLVFVPGKREISNTITGLAGQDATILPLHGEMDWDDQKKCFESYSNPKVIVATNVAQTSITIPDIDVVVDTGKERISIASDGIQGLFLKDISRSDIRQRMGRAGRTHNGKYILCSNTSIEEREEFSIPEIQRSILDRVVLQLAAMGVDAEKLSFYHQPDHKAIIQAKRELRTIGALNHDNVVTELGKKIVKIPVSVQLARMIVEAEKYGVIEQVVTIASIVYMGGLLDNNTRYWEFTEEKESDLLAELDVWNHLKMMKYIDFNKLGIKRKTFYRIKDHISKLKEVLSGIVDFSSNNSNREAILKSCFCGWISNIYTLSLSDFYTGDDQKFRRIDKKSCINYEPFFLIGMPKTIEVKDRFDKDNMIAIDLISFASRVSGKELIELIPEQIEEVIKTSYSVEEDAVEVMTFKTYKGLTCDSSIEYDYNHPEYETLKKEYLRRHEVVEVEKAVEEEKVVVIDGKEFAIDHWHGRSIIYLDDETIFTTEVKEVFLKDGTRVYVSKSFFEKEKATIPELRNAVEMKRIRAEKEKLKFEYEHISSSVTLDSVLENQDMLGEVELTTDNGGYGNNLITVYGCIFFKKKSVSFSICDDKEIASSNTSEALQYLFMKEIEKKFGENKFSHQSGKKKKILTDAEKEVKLEFDSLVRELVSNLTIESAKENMEFLEEYYSDLMAG